jgi:hypothetical protein
MYYFKLIGVCIMALAVVHFFFWEVRDMISVAAVKGFKPSTNKITLSKWWLKKPWSCIACLSMWTSIVLFILLGEPLVFGVYLGAIYLEK